MLISAQSTDSRNVEKTVLDKEIQTNANLAYGEYPQAVRSMTTSHGPELQMTVRENAVFNVQRNVDVR